MDNEENVRLLMADALQGHGWIITQAGTVSTALEAFRQAPEGFDILVTDVGLPGGMNGRQLAKAAHDRQPDLPVLLITGYAGDALGPQVPLKHGIKILRKPFSLEALEASVRRMLRRRPAML